MELAEYIQERAMSRAAERVLGAAVVILLIAGLISAATVEDSARPRRASASELRLLSDAASQYEAVTTAKLSFRIDVDAAGRHVTVLMDGAADNQRRLGDFTMTFHGAPEASALADGLRLVQSGSTLFAAVPEDRRSRTGGKSWVSTQAPASAAVEAATSTSPTSFLELLQRDTVTGTEIVRLDDEDVRGIRTAHYRAQIDVGRIAERAASAGGTAPTAAQLSQAGLEEMPLDVYLDDHGVPRRTATSVHAHGFSLAFEFDIYDVGRPVDLAEPPGADEAFAVGTVPEVFSIVSAP